MPDLDELERQLGNRASMRLHRQIVLSLIAAARAAERLRAENERLQTEIEQARVTALETIRLSNEAVELRIYRLREQHDVETKPLYAVRDQLQAENEKVLGENARLRKMVNEAIQASAAFSEALKRGEG
jgi:hypothetical protein